MRRQFVAGAVPSHGGLLVSAHGSLAEVASAHEVSQCFVMGFRADKSFFPKQPRCPIMEGAPRWPERV